MARVDGLDRVGADGLPAALYRAAGVGGHMGRRQVAGEGHPRVEDEGHAVVRVSGRGDDLAVEAETVEQRAALGDGDDQGVVRRDGLEVVLGLHILPKGRDGGELRLQHDEPDALVIIHGTDDTIVPYADGERLAAAVMAQG